MSNAELLDELQTLSDTKSSDSRRQLLHRITDLFETTSNEQDTNHRDAFGDIMDRLAFELEATVRAEFSNRLAELANPPTQLAEKFAVDEISVARPMLENSKCLSNEFLVEVAKNQSQEHLLAISGRPTVDSAVTEVLVERGDETVLENVTSNQGAKFSRKSFETLSIRANSNSALNTLLETRKDTPADILETVKKRVSEKIKQEALDAGIHISDEEIDKTVDLKSANIEISDAEQEAAFQEIDYLHKRKQLSERVIMHYIKLNKVAETTYALSLITDLEENVVSNCLLQAELPALAVMCKANHFRRTTFASLLQLRENLSDISGTEIIDAIRRYEDLELETAQRVMRFLKVRKINSKNDEQNIQQEIPEEIIT